MTVEYLADLDGKLAYCTEDRGDDGIVTHRWWLLGGTVEAFRERFGFDPDRFGVRAYRCGTGSLWGIDVQGHQFLLPGDRPCDKVAEFRIPGWRKR